MVLRVYTRDMQDDICLCTRFRQAAQAGTALYDAVLAPAGLKVTMFRLLRQISRPPEPSITELAQRVGLDRSTLGRNLRVLEKQGLVGMPNGDDERMRRIALTPKGTSALSAALPLWQDAQRQVRQAVGDDIDGVLVALGRITDLAHNKDR